MTISAKIGLRVREKIGLSRSGSLTRSSELSLSHELSGASNGGSTGRQSGGNSTSLAGVGGLAEQVKELNSSIKSLSKSIESISKKQKSFSDELSKILGIASSLIGIAGGLIAVFKNMDKILTAIGSGASNASAMMGKWSARAKVLGAVFSDLAKKKLVEFASSVKNKVISNLQKASSKMKAFWSGLQFLGRIVKHLAANLFIRFGGVIAQLSRFFGTVLVQAIFLVVRALAGLALLASSITLPVLAIVAAVAALAASAYLIYKNWEPIKSFFANLINSVKAFFADGFLNGINKILYAFNPAVIIGTAIQNVVKALTGVDLYAEGSKLFQGLFDGAKDMWAQFSTWIVDAISSLPAKLGGGAIDFFRKVTGFLKPAPDQFEETTNGQLTISERIKPKSNGRSTDSLIFGGKAVGNLGQQGALPGGPASNTKVGGRLDIKIDAQGNARVAKLEKNGPMDLDVSTGRMMASA